MTPLCILAGTAATSAAYSWATEQIANNLYWAPKKEQSSVLQGKNPPYWLTQYPGSRFILLYFHGRGCVVKDMIPTLKYFSERLQISVICPEYPAYTHDCTKVCNQVSLEECARGILKQLLQAGYQPEEILVHGYSLGCNPALYLANLLEKGEIKWIASNARSKPTSEPRCFGGLYLENPMLSVAHVVKDNLKSRNPWNPFASVSTTQSYQTSLPYLESMVDWLCQEWDNAERIQQLQNTPIIISHGRNDTLIPFYHSQLLFDKASSCKQKQLLLHNGDHATDFAILENALMLLHKQMKTAVSNPKTD